MPSKERAGGKELEIMKSISTQGGRRPGSFASRMPTTYILCHTERRTYRAGMNSFTRSVKLAKVAYSPFPCAAASASTETTCSQALPLTAQARHNPG